MKLKNSTVIVTGASSGIGREAAREFARGGSNVVLASRNQAALEEFADELSVLPGRRLVIPTDVRDRTAVEAMAQRTVEEFGRVDVLVNNAGLGLRATMADGDVENMRYIMDVNIFGLIHGVQAVVPQMKRQGGGCIVNISSVAGRISTPFNGFYSATKAAVTAISDALRLELEGYGIKVIAIYPGFTVTGFQENAIQEVDVPRPSGLLRGVPASAAGQAVVQAVRRDAREAFVTFGDATAVTVKNLAPRLVDWGVRRFWLGSLLETDREESQEVGKGAKLDTKR